MGKTPTYDEVAGQVGPMTVMLDQREMCLISNALFMLAEKHEGLARTVQTINARERQQELVVNIKKLRRRLNEIDCAWSVKYNKTMQEIVRKMKSEVRREAARKAAITRESKRLSR